MALELLTREEAAERARISVRTLYAEIARGYGPRLTRIGGRVFVRADILDQWLQECTEAPVRPAAVPDGPAGAMLAQAQGRMHQVVGTHIP